MGVYELLLCTLLMISTVTRTASLRRLSTPIVHWNHRIQNQLRRPRFYSRDALVLNAASTPEKAQQQLQPHNVPEFTKEMAEKYFDHGKLERGIYDWWEESGYFKPKTDTKHDPYVIPMPPPNVTGYLHMGHAIFVTLQDILARFHRMRGRPTLWVPGTDHAGIATQLLVERALAAEGDGVTRQSLGREKFLERVWEWKNEKGGYITGQMRRLGASADWTRERFTLEDGMSASVTEAFVQLYEKGLIYKGNYMVNWSPHLQTAVSDLEVEYSEEAGKLYYFKYLLEDESVSTTTTNSATTTTTEGSSSQDNTAAAGTAAVAVDPKMAERLFIPVATTRPETIIGDTAVCVHPQDERYKAFIGRNVVVPMLGRSIPVIADEYVDREFGTGALKITPGHDPNDYTLGKKFNLPIISIMNRDASINSEGGERYAGLDRFTCREKIWKDMEKAGLVIKAEDHTQRVPRSQRGGEIIEPMVSAQWFVRTKEMGRKAVDVVRSGEVRIIPDRFEKTWYNWLENIHDWCISRQLWWGHRIPVYYIKGTTTSSATSTTTLTTTSTTGSSSGSSIGSSSSAEAFGGGEDFVVARSMDEAQVLAREKLGKGPHEVVELVQDEDVLDTWFSSGLWPFATVGWPSSPVKSTTTTTSSSSKEITFDAGMSGGAEVADYARFYPATVLETGYDILFFWVARMVMMGIELTDKAPFQVIYLHGLVRDGQGRKMSKTTGNVIDPLDTIESFGCDALRYSLVTGTTPGQDVPLSMEKVEANRNFGNKLWNAGKYIQNCLNGVSAEESIAGLAVTSPFSAEELAALALPERYIVSRCHQLVHAVTDSLESYSFGDAGKQIYEFLWDEFADWYIEASKSRMRSEDPEVKRASLRVLVYVWDTCLRLLHPFMPYLTEVLWQNLPHEGSSIMVSSWPQELRSNEKDGEKEDGSGGSLPVDTVAIAQFNTFQQVVRVIRNARSEYNVDAGKKLTLTMKAPAGFRSQLQRERGILCNLARLEESELIFLEEGQERPLDERTRSTTTTTTTAAAAAAKGREYVHLIVEDGVEAFIPQDGLVDKEKEIARLSKQSSKLVKDIGVLETRLESKGFVDKAPADLVLSVKANLQDMKDQLKTVESALEKLNA